jgi:hypothetical protein
MDYDFKYRLQATPTATNDGSGMVNHDIYAICCQQGNGGWSVVPGRHKTISVPHLEMKVINDMPDSTSPEKQAKNTAYKSALQDNLNTTPIPNTGWSAAQLEELMDENDSSADEASRANAYITETLGLDYPADFVI